LAQPPAARRSTPVARASRTEESRVEAALAQASAGNPTRPASGARGRLLASGDARGCSLSAERADGPAGGAGGGPENEYFLQVGVAIRTLRDDFPLLFEREPSLDIFRDDVTFVDRVGLPGAPAHAAGLEEYKRVFWQLRMHRSLFYSRCHVSILRIWQPRERTLAVRWSVAAAPRILASLGAGDMHYDGISWYKLDSRGKIYEHVLDNVDWGDPPLARNGLSSILAGIVAPAQPTPSFFAQAVGLAGGAYRGLAAAARALRGGGSRADSCR
jgi:hypothetical protein